MMHGITYWFKRRKWYALARRSPLAPLYLCEPTSLKKTMHEQRFLVVDCEMTGLDPKSDELLSIGWVEVEDGRIDYSSRKHILIHSQKGVGDSIRIHGLCDQRLAGASSPSIAIGLLAKQMEGAVLVFHHAHLDIAFLQRLARNSFACPLLFSYIDTMQIERQRFAVSGQAQPLQLAACRERYGLPAAFQHNAMSDAVATAELFLAQSAYLTRSDKLNLSAYPVSVA